MTALAGYLALGTIDGAGAFVEITGGAYARQAVSLLPDSSGMLKSTADLTFPVATGADWPQVSAYALFDAPAGGNIIMFWAVSSAITAIPKLGKAWSVRAGRIAITMSSPTGPFTSHGTSVTLVQPIVPSSAGPVIAQGAGAAIVVLSAARALTAADNGQVLRSDSATGIVLTVPGNLPAGFNVAVMQWGAGAVSFAAASGAVARSTPAATSKQYGVASLLVGKNATSAAAEYVLGGDVA